MLLSFFEKHNKFSWFITFTGACLIFYISTLDFGGTSYGVGFLSLIYHFSAFFCFAFFMLISITKGKLKGINFFLGILFSIVYAISDEIHQFFVPWRYCSIGDVIVDSAGIIFAFVIYLIIVLWRRD